MERVDPNAFGAGRNSPRVAIQPKTQINSRGAVQSTPVAGTQNVDSLTENLPPAPGFNPAVLPLGGPGRRVAGWRVCAHDAVDSTQSHAIDLPAWHAVTARRQTAGRGQRDRRFVSDEGGLYVTAVVPFDGDAVAWKGFALAVGWAVRLTLQRAGVRGLRLRWPNDLLVGARKVGGLLVTQGRADTLCVGLGLNVTNQPWNEDPTLAETSGRLADFATRSLPGSGRLTELVLRAIRAAHRNFLQRRLAGFVPVLNCCWGRPRRVRLEAAARGTLPADEGFFAGIDESGHVLLELADSRMVAVPENGIQRLVEIAD